MRNLKFTKSTRNNITFLATVTNFVAALLIAFFGYLISRDVRDIQKQTEQRARAKEFHDFWNEMQTVARKAEEQSGRFGEALTKFTITAGQLVDEYANHYRRKSLDNLTLDPKYMAAYAAYFAAYVSILSAIDSVRTEYTFLRIRYSALASTHNVVGWDLFANQDQAVATWYSEVLTPIENITNSIKDILTNQKDPAPVVSQLTQEFSRLGGYLVTKPIPYANGLSQLLDANLKAQADSVKRH